MRIAITGGSGLLALNWAIAMRDTHEICLLLHNREVVLSGTQTRRVSLSSSEEIGKFLAEWQADLIVNTAGMTNVDQCEKNPEAAFYANSTIAESVANAAQKNNVALVHISTDHLFSGKAPLVNEETEPAPLNVYASSKLEGERRVRKCYPEALIVRTNFYGWGHSFRTSLSDWVISSLRKGETIKAFADVWFTPILIDHLVVAVHELMNRGVVDVVNIVGDKRLSKYEFAMRLADAFSLDKKLIIRANSQSNRFEALRPEDLSLSNQKVVRLLERKLGSIEDGLCELREQELTGRHNELFTAISN